MAALKNEFVLWSGYESTEEWLYIVEWLWQHGTVVLYCGVVMAALNSDFVLWSGYGSTEE